MIIIHDHIEIVLKFIHEGLKAHFEEGKPWPEILPIDLQALAELARMAQQPAGRAIASDPDLLDAVHRMDTVLGCPAFSECPLDRCDGQIFCRYYNLGGSHGYDSGGNRIKLSREERREKILEMFRGDDSACSPTSI